MLRRHSLIAMLAVVASLVSGAALQAQDQSTSGSKKLAAPTATAPLNINTATAAQLETLPGVGPAVAARIIEYRQKNGNFKKVEELMNVKGIGEKAFLKIKALVSVAPSKTSDK